ncbi:MAG: acyl carrier protein [Spirochaetales bacterium]|nr:acyl carrier protein [Spirochaetales bacterium]
MAELTKLSTEEIAGNIRVFIIDNFLFGNEVEMVAAGESFMENGLIDSTGILELIEYVEETYSIEVEDHELIPENLDSLENISAFILRKKG